MWQAIIHCYGSQIASKVIRLEAQKLGGEIPVAVTFKVIRLEAILLAYKECDNRSTKTQILSIICNKYSQSQIQEFLPGISLRQIKNARKHAQGHGPRKPIVKEQIFRCRLDMEMVKEFVYFISRSTFLQDVSFGTKTLKLCSGKSLPIPALFH